MITPPKRPNKSKLRNSGTHLNLSSESLPSKYRSRFTEQFDLNPIGENTLFLNKPTRPLQKSPLRPSSLKTSQSTITITPSLNHELQLPIDVLTTTTVVSPKQRLKLTSSKSTPLINHNTKHHQLTVGSLNRADIIISRLEGWHMCLKSVIAWLEEVSRINISNSKSYSHKAFSVLDESCAISSKKVLGQDTSEQVNDSIFTIQAGLQVLTKQLAAEMKQTSRTVDKKHIPELTKLSKQVKEKIHKLKNNSALVLDELLKRAQVTRAKMTVLSRCCKQAEKHKGPIETDPWLANLMVLKQLKREIDEENRLRLLMIPIQQEAKELEQKVVNAIKPAVEYCYRTLAPGAWDGSSDSKVAPFQLVLDQITPDSDWEKFEELNKSNLVDEHNPTKDYLKINYPNKFHPLVMTVIKGTMERRIGVRKQFVKREFVLTQGGYLHEFTFGTKLTPEKTTYIPNTTIIPSADINQLIKDNVLLEYGYLDLTFDICKPATNILQKDKVITFKVSSKTELINWCLALLSKSNPISNEPQEESSFSSRLFPRSRSSSMKRKTSTSTSVGSGNSSTHLYIKKHDTKKLDAEESSIEKTPTTSDFPIFPPVIPEDEQVADTNLTTDTESFVTARLNESIYPDDENETGTIDDFFSYSRSDEEDDDDDNASIATAKATSSGHITKSPSLTSTQFDDAHSSLYYSSQSRPPSPTPSDDHSSVASMPEFDLLDRVIPVEGQSSKPTDADMYKSSVNLKFDSREEE